MSTQPQLISDYGCEQKLDTIKFSVILLLLASVSTTGKFYACPAAARHSKVSSKRQFSAQYVY